MTVIGAGGARIIGHYLGFTQADYFKRAISHAVFRGTLAKAQGGNFRNGFMSTFFSTMAGIVKVGAGWAQGAWQSIVGGTASVIGGGKFANGAVSAAATWMFNDAYDNGISKKMNDRSSQDFRRKHPNSFSIHAHGDSSSFDIDHITYDDKMDARTLIRLLKGYGWNGKQDIILFACNTGKGNNSIAEYLSRTLHVNVYAPNNYYVVGDTIPRYLGLQGHVGNDIYSEKLFHISNGHFRTFKGRDHER